MSATGDGLTPERWESVKELYLRALELPASERSAFVARTCGADRVLAQAVEKMLTDRAAATPLEDVVGIVSAAHGAGEVARVLGPCTLLEEIGSGSMGTVYRARQDPPGRDVAVKVLHARLASDERSVERFRRESERLARLSHPGIVQVYLVDVQRGQHYFVMELVRGHDLGAELDSLRGPAGQRAGYLPRADRDGYFAAVAALVRDAALTLEHAHRHGIVHRDVKPQNLLLAPDASVKLTDFGIARDESLGSLTRTGDVVGTPHYMSPEQARRGVLDVDHRSDVYSLGVVLYELLTLRRPFDGPSQFIVMQRILDSDPPLPRRLNPRIPSDLEAICCKAMAHDASHRYAWAADFAADLSRFLAHEAVIARPIGAVERGRRWLRRNRVRVAAVGLVALGASVGWGTVSAKERSSARVARLERVLARLAEPAETDEQLDADRLVLRERERDPESVGDDAELARAYDALQHRFDLRAKELEERAAAALQRTFPPPRVELHGVRTTWEGDGVALIDALQRLARVRGGLPAELGSRIAATDSITVRARVRGVAAERVRVLAEPLDEIHGQPADARVVPTHLESGSVLVFQARPGPVRFWFDAGPDGFAELTRRLHVQEQPLELVATIATTAEVEKGMLRVPAGTCSLEYDLDTAGASRAGVSLQHPIREFRIDVRPVSNAEYARFLAATQRPLPDWWPAEITPEWERLPATRVDQAAAREYAESLGKRLLTEAEWQWAVRGPTPRLHPVGVDAQAPDLSPFNLDRLAPQRNLPTRAAQRAELVAWSLANLRPAGALAGYAATPGLSDVFGNVSEWTDTWHFDRGESALQASPDLAILAGVPCDLPPGVARGAGLVFRMQVPVTQAQIDIGFRCARSVRVPDVK